MKEVDSFEMGVDSDLGETDEFIDHYMIMLDHLDESNGILEYDLDDSITRILL